MATGAHEIAGLEGALHREKPQIRIKMAAT
jgi:hypothetical protein